MVILVIMAVINGVGQSSIIRNSYTSQDIALKDPFLSPGMQSSVTVLATMLSACAMFIGVLSLSDEKAEGVARVLITKLLYRRDIIAGKFLGFSAFIVLLTTFGVLLYAASLMVFYCGPRSPGDFY